jgi:hypothetical protein
MEIATEGVDAGLRELKTMKFRERFGHRSFWMAIQASWLAVWEMQTIRQFNWLCNGSIIQDYLEAGGWIRLLAWSVFMLANLSCSMIVDGVIGWERMKKTTAIFREWTELRYQNVFLVHNWSRIDDVDRIRIMSFGVSFLRENLYSPVTSYWGEILYIRKEYFIPISTHLERYSAVSPGMNGFRMSTISSFPHHVIYFPVLQSDRIRTIGKFLGWQRSQDSNLRTAEWRGKNTTRNETKQK